MEEIDYSPLADSIAKTIDTYDPKGSILVIAPTANCIRLNKNVFHEITGYGSSMEDIQQLISEIPNGEFIHWDFLNGLIPGTLTGRKFKFIVSMDALEPIHFSARIDFIKRLIESNLEDGGILFVGGKISKKRKPCTKDWEITYEEYKKAFPSMAFMEVTTKLSILAIAKGKSTDDDYLLDELASDQLPSYWYGKAMEEMDEELAKEDSRNSRDAKYVEPDIETVLTWKYVRDIPGDTVLELGGNFMAAIRRFEEEARGNWSYFGPRLQNLYGAAFTTNDIINFRAGAVNNYFSATNPKLSKDRDYCEWLARLYSAVYVSSHFPNETISINTFGLYYGLLTDLRSIFLTIGSKYKSISKVRDEIDHLKGSQLADILLSGFEHNNF